ncbi:MAG TPA: phosphoribosylformylglycinamidine cyclo-ligase [Polyangiaceae bacterium]|nr:phosphoribosylformylglycinamidine cyclo-ligase [Polyangiaceae bacterium]
MSITYRQAGVDIDAGDELVERIKPLARATRIKEVFDDIGGFAGLCRVPSDVEEPLLVSGTDGVGTKLKIAFATGRHDTIGQDLVAMCVNDVVTCGARPLFFLDYFGCGRLELAVAESVIKGIADGCKLAGCALIGGETAELPGMYTDGEYDLAGFAVGIVARKKLLGPQRVAVGDRVLGVASTGLHSNGYSLARRVFEKELKLGYDTRVPELNQTVGEALLVPTRIYARQVQALLEATGEHLHALCHVTGGGLPGNLPRVLPQGTHARIRLPAPPALFQLIARGGPVDSDEMLRTFNMGIGLVVVVKEEAADAARRSLTEQGETVHDLGVIVADSAQSEPTVIFD